METLQPFSDQTRINILYQGVGVSGRTTNLLYIHHKLADKSKGDVVSWQTEEARRISFDFVIPVSQTHRGHSVSFRLYCSPGAVHYQKQRDEDLRHADGVVFIVDSHSFRFEANQHALREMEDTLQQHGQTLKTIPWVIQYNKRDRPDILSIQKLQDHLNLYSVPFFEAVATEGKGVFETLSAIIRRVIPAIDEACLVESGIIRPSLYKILDGTFL